MAGGDVMMPWGKHSGELICDIESGYLKWLAENCEDEEICEAADEEFSFRSDNSTHFYD